MNVLVITFSFPPAGGVGVLRALSLAKYFPDNGIRVDVLTARNAPAVGRDEALLQQVPPGVRIHRCWTLDLPFGLRKLIKALLSRRTPANAAPAQLLGKPIVKPNFLKTFVANLLLPDPQVGWLPFALPAARRIIKQRGIDLVLITVPPFSSVRLVTKLRTVFPALPIVLDFRDEWLTTTINLVSFNNNDRARTIAQQAELEAVRDATAVVAVTEAAVRELRLRYPEALAEKFHYIPNGFDTVASSLLSKVRQHPDAPPVIVTYMGSIYGSTDPRSIVEAIQGLPAIVRSQLLVRFIGHVETLAYRDALLALGKNVELKGFLPQAQALDALEDTHYLLLISHDSINVSAKFYDYLGAGKPILGVLHPLGDIRKRLEETRTGWWADASDVAAIRQMLVDAVHRTLDGQDRVDPDRNVINGYHRKTIAERYAALLRVVVRGSGV